MKIKKNLYSNSDFLASYLPRSRKEQFKFVFKTRKPLLMKIGFVLLLSALLFIAALGIKGSVIFNTYLLVEAGTWTEKEFFAFFLAHSLVFGLICVGLYFIITIFLSGIFNIYKKLLFGEPVFFMRDLLHGIKINIKSFILISLFLNIFISILLTVYFFIGLNFYLLIAFILFVGLIVPFFVNLYFYKSIYSSNFQQTIVNGGKLYIITNFKSIGLSLGLLLIPTLFIILMDLLEITVPITLAILVIYFLFFAPTYLLIMYFYFGHEFDEHLNRECFPNYYRKGLYNIENDE